MSKKVGPIEENSTNVIAKKRGRKSKKEIEENHKQWRTDKNTISTWLKKKLEERKQQTEQTEQKNSAQRKKV